MTRLEEQLRAALKREDPSPDFTARVLSRVAKQPEKRTAGAWLHEMLAVPRLRWATAAVAAIVIAAGVGVHVEEQRRAEGEAAKQQVMLALRITSEKWRVAAKEIDSNTGDRGGNSRRDVENPE